MKANKTHTQTLYAYNSKSEHSVETKPPTAVAPASAPAPHEQGSHATRRHGGGYSGARVEHPLLRKSCFLHRRGRYFQNITFLGPVEKGHRDVVNHMPWRTATRHCVHSVMPSCMTPLCCKQCVSTASTGLARRRRQGRAPPRRIVLSYAPSAAAVWQCDRVRAMCESNSVRHKVFFKALGLAPLGVLWQPHHNIIISECHNIIIA